MCSVAILQNQTMCPFNEHYIEQIEKKRILMINVGCAACVKYAVWSTSRASTTNRNQLYEKHVFMQVKVYVLNRN